MLESQSTGAVPLQMGGESRQAITRVEIKADTRPVVVSTEEITDLILSPPSLSLNLRYAWIHCKTESSDKKEKKKKKEKGEEISIHLRPVIKRVVGEFLKDRCLTSMSP